jgi:hypothetical protein
MKGCVLIELSFVHQLHEVLQTVAALGLIDMIDSDPDVEPANFNIDDVRDIISTCKRGRRVTSIEFSPLGRRGFEAEKNRKS